MQSFLRDIKTLTNRNFTQFEEKNASRIQYFIDNFFVYYMKSTTFALAIRNDSNKD